MDNNIEFPLIFELQVNNVFKETITISLFQGITTFIGPNGTGKTQTLKTLRDYLKANYGENKVRFLSSNRIGLMEQYRSKTDQCYYNISDYQVGDQNTKSHRHEIETSTGDFFTMDECKDVYIKVAERLSVMFNRQIYLRWDSGNMKVFFEKKNEGEEYSVAAEASGLVNVISILAALFDKDIKFLLIDEPEVSLHPQLQSYLLREMRDAVKKYGKTIIISTHSSEMISLNMVEDISNFIFFSDNNLPKQLEKDTPELKNKKLGDFILRISQVYKNGFFAKKILLIEGTSDLIVCRYLADKLGYNIDVAGTQIIPIDGKGQFSIVAKLFRLINKEVAILTDLDGFIDDNSIVELFLQLSSAKEIASQHGANNMSNIVNGVRKKIADMINKHFEDMKYVYEKHPYWINKKTDDDENKIAKRSMIGMLFCSDSNEINNWKDSKEWQTTKTQIESLLSMLEKLGCFILKKGAIESYYQYVSNCTYIEKPSAAAEEVSKLERIDCDTIKNNYSDIINAIKYVSLVNEVDESFAVKKELLSELALALELVKNNVTENDLYAAIKQSKNNSASLFDYHIITEETRKGINVGLKSSILQVKGFPFNIFIGENVNEVVERKLRDIKLDSEI